MRHSNGNVHVEIDGSFTSDKARQLSLFLATQYRGSGNIFIHTDRMDKVEPESPKVLCDWLAETGIPVDRVFAMGKRGIELSNEELRAIVPKKRHHGHHGCGKCMNCTCGKKTIGDEIRQTERSVSIQSPGALLLNNHEETQYG